VALSAILYMDGVREQQSGITRNGMATGSETLDAKSAYEARKEDRNEQVRKRLMARMLAETLLVPVFRKILKNIVRYQDAERTIKLRGSWVSMDPRAWNADLKAKVAVGLGYANKDEELQAAMTVGNLQMTAKDMGLVEPHHLFATADKVVRAVGWKFAGNYFTDPASPEGKQALAARTQQAPDPKMVEAQSRMQLEQAKTQHTGQLKEQELAFKMREAQMRADMDRQIAMLKAESERQIAEMRIAAEMQAEAKRLEAETSLAMWQNYKGSNGVRFGGQIG
jgi:hypothetical protein